MAAGFAARAIFYTITLFVLNLYFVQDASHADLVAGDTLDSTRERAE